MNKQILSLVLVVLFFMATGASCDRKDDSQGSEYSTESYDEPSSEPVDTSEPSNYEDTTSSGDTPDSDTSYGDDGYSE